LSPRYCVKVLDFGLARLQLGDDRASCEGAVLGTRALAAGLDRRIQPTLFVVQCGEEELQFPVVLRIRVPGLTETVRAVTFRGPEWAHAIRLRVVGSRPR
jgi:hypothetical protein